MSGQAGQASAREDGRARGRNDARGGMRLPTDAVGKVTANVASTVEAVPWVGRVERVLQELLLGRVVQAQVAGRHVRRPHVQLAHLADAAPQERCRQGRGEQWSAGGSERARGVVSSTAHQGTQRTGREDQDLHILHAAASGKDLLAAVHRRIVQHREVAAMGRERTKAERKRQFGDDAASGRVGAVARRT